MATLNITELAELARDSQGNIIQAPKMPAVAKQNVSYTTSTQSTAFNSATKFIRVVADADAYLEFGTNPTATDTSTRLPADRVEYFCVIDAQEVAAYDGSS